jgi:hypothetical protein
LTIFFVLDCPVGQILPGLQTFKAMHIQSFYRSPTQALSVPCRPGAPTYKLQDKTRSRTCIHAPPPAIWLRTPLPYRGELRRCYVSSGSGPCLPAEVSSDAATCSVAPDLASWLRWAPAPPRVLRLRTSLPCWDGL